jgi:hypothetical protein
MRQSLIRLRHASITTFSAASLVAAPLVEIDMCPVESDIAIEIQLPSACASGVAANATPIPIATTAFFFMGFPTLLHGNTLTRPEQFSTHFLLLSGPHRGVHVVPKAGVGASGACIAPRRISIRRHGLRADTSGASEVG